MKKKALSWLSVLAIFISLIGCGKNNPVAPSMTPEKGKMNFAVSVAGTPMDNIVSGQVTITKGSLMQTQAVAIANHAGTVTFVDVQTGKWAIAVQLFDQDGAEIYSGTGEGVVHKNQTTMVHIQVNHNTGNLEVVVEVPEPVTISKIIFFKDFSGTFCTINSDGTDRRDLITFPTYDVLSATNYRGGEMLVYSVYSSTINDGIVYGMNLDGSNVHAIKENVQNPRWSWDGSKLGAVKSIQTGEEYHSAICIFNPDGSGEQVLPQTNGEGEDEFLCWTPDNRIVYHHIKGPGQVAVYVTTMDGGTRTKLTDYSDNGLRVNDCSLDSKVVGVMGENENVYLLNLHGSGLIQVTTDSHNMSPAFSKDGQSIVYCHFDDNGGYDLYTVNRDGSNSLRLTNTPEGEFSPHFIY